MLDDLRKVIILQRLKHLGSDLKATYWSDNFVAALNATNAFNIKTVDASLNGTDYALTNRLRTLLILPSGFNTSANMTLYSNGVSTANIMVVYDQSTSSGPAVQGIVLSIVD